MTSSTESRLRDALAHPLAGTSFELGEKYEGKVRDNYVRQSLRFLVTSDRVSAFDRVLGTLPLKGQVLQWVSSFWFRHTERLVPHHLVEVVDPNVIVAHNCEPLPVEMVVRGYITGVTSTSMWTHYEAGSRNFCGHALPDGLQKHQSLDRPLLTPSSKAAKGDHDRSLSREEILAQGRISADDFDRAAELALILYQRGVEHCRARGLILVDSKYEFGRAPSGEIVVIDEVHTPDSSRFWKADTYAKRFAAGNDPESFDKEYLRRWLADQGFRGDGPVPPIPDEIKVEAMRRYVEACETIVGESFTPDLQPPTSRIEANLRRAGYLA
ncbi:MAG: phosphoribosylaminoimidazolesuccinocarboxamide synthase [Myxococcota bacterium]